MNTRRIFFVLFSLLTFMDAKAQLEGIPNHSMTLIPVKATNLSEVEGSSYFNGEEFTPGSVHIGGKELDVFIRYNVAEERMEIKASKADDEIYQLGAKQNIKYSFGEKDYILNKINFEGRSIYGYFIQYYDGEEVDLVGKPVAEFSEAEKAKTGYGSDKPARIDITEDYYLVFEDGRVEEVRTKKRDLRNAFESEEVDEYLKGKRIKSVEDLISVARFYNENFN